MKCSLTFWGEYMYYSEKNFGVRSAVVSTLASPSTSPGLIPGLGIVQDRFACTTRSQGSASATSSARDLKQGCSLRTHVFKIMRGLKRTCMSKQKSWGLETDRLCWHAQTPRRRNVAAYRQAIENGHIRISSSAQGYR